MPKAAPKGTPRSQWTIKGASITPELRNAVKLAARRLKSSQAEYVAKTLWAAAQADLTHKPEPQQPAQPPARVDELASRLDKLADQVALLAARKTPAERAVETIVGWIWPPTSTNDR